MVTPTSGRLMASQATLSVEENSVTVEMTRKGNDAAVLERSSICSTSYRVGA
jgi:hypothetical protein